MSRLVLPQLALIFAIALVGPPLLAQTAAEKRVAIVIGIGDYRDPLVGKLEHPKPDAVAVTQKLRDLGFAVDQRLDTTKQQLLEALNGFVQDHRGADAVLVYFTGHGLQIGGRNYLLPTDANFATTAELRQSALPLDEVVSRVAQVAPSRIVLLDACRDDPTHPAPNADPLLAIGPGLGRIGRADGTIYAFSTAPGATAEDGHGDHSPFAEALLEHLGDKGLEFGSVMKLVQMEVYERTPTHQVPYVEDALPSLFFAGTQAGPLPERDRLLLAMARLDGETRMQVERMAKAKDVPLAPLYALFVTGALSGKGDDAKEELLAQAADDFIKVRADLRTLASSDPEVTRLRTEAEHSLSLGAIAEARAALTRAIEVDQSSAEALLERLRDRKMSEAASRAARAGVARTRAEYRAAASDFAVAANLAERWGTQEMAWRYTIDQASDLVSLGDEFGDSAAIAEAIEVLGKALKLAPHELRPSEWAATEDRLGIALRILVERETGTQRVEQSITAFREALKERTRERQPLDWAATQSHLGFGLVQLGQRETGTAHLEEAVEVLRQALEEQTRERAPVEWGWTQNNLGLALLNLGQRESGPTRLQEAVTAFREAQKELTRERMPLLWAKMQNNIGATLMALGEREANTAYLEEAIAAFREALQEHTRERMPIAWARHQSNIGRVLAALGAKEDGTARLQEAVAAFREALKEWTRERVPPLWADAQVNLGNALRLLGERERGTEQLEQAVGAYREALKEITRERSPLAWGDTQADLGIAFVLLGERENSTYQLAEAIAAYREALNEVTRERAPVRWAVVQLRLGNALMEFGLRDRGTAHLEEAVAAYREALKEETRERAPLNWMLCIGNQGVALAHLSQRTENVAMANTAIEQITTALESVQVGGSVSNASYYEARLAEARTIRDRLAGGGSDLEAVRGDAAGGVVRSPQK